MLAAAGLASRRAAEDLIRAGRVTVNGEVVTTLGTRVDKRDARIEVDGERIAVDPARYYFALNKPAGYVTTAHDELGRPTVIDLVPSRERVYPVGRLDADTTGLLILTNDGDLAHRLSHPRYRVERVYLAEVAGEFEPPAIRALLDGVRLGDGTATADRARVIQASRGKSQVEIVMHEGRKREVRRMLDAVGHPVIRLVRTSYGPIPLGRLHMGKTRELSAAEVGSLQRLVGL